VKNKIKKIDFQNIDFEDEIEFILNINTNSNCIFTKSSFFIQNGLSRITVCSDDDLKISCGAVSINKDIFELNIKHHILQNEYCLGDSKSPSIDADMDKLYTSSESYLYDNPKISYSMVWVGLEEKHKKYDILTCFIVNSSNPSSFQTLNLKDIITFEPGDKIEKIRVDINDPEIVTVFGKFTATITFNGKTKKIHNAMVIYTKLQDVSSNNKNYAYSDKIITPYSLTYNSFESITVKLPEFEKYSFVDGLVVASNNGGGTKQQNMGVLLIKTNEVTPVIIGFHENKVTKLKGHDTDIWSNILCYDYSMCADKWMWNNISKVPVLEKGILNPLLFIGFKNTIQPGSASRTTELYNGNFVLVTSKDYMPSDTLSRVHVLNTWGIDLSNEYTPFYRRIFESDEGNKTFRMEIYQKYMDKVLDTIIGSAKEYYEDKIKTSIYNGEYGTVINSNTSSASSFTGGGRKESAAAIVIAKEVELKEYNTISREIELIIVKNI
jgi:hypothetical protein